MVEAAADDAAHVLLRHLVAALIRHQRLGGAVDDEIAAQAVDLEARADVGDQDLKLARDLDPVCVSELWCSVRG